MQAWKKLANSLKLRLALRASGAPGADFAASAASSAIASGVLGDQDALLQRHLTGNTWASATYGDVWYPFYSGGHWNLGFAFVDALRDNNDPRIRTMAKPSNGGTISVNLPTEGENVGLIDKHIDFLRGILDHAGAQYTLEKTATTVEITMPEGVNYVGFPTRVNGRPKPYLHTDLFSKPADIVTNQMNTGKDIFPWVVMSAGDSHLMVAEAIVKGLASGDAQAHYQTGIRKSMELWTVPGGEIDDFLANEDMAQLTGSVDEQLEKIATQRWIANFTNGFESWAIVRDTGYPAALHQGVSDPELHALGTTLNGAYPERMRYGNSVYGTNGDNVSAANSAQGPDVQGTKLWWAKQ